MQRDGAALRQGEDADCVALVLVDRHEGDSVGAPAGQAGQEAPAPLRRPAQRLPVQAQVLCRDGVCAPRNRDAHRGQGAGWGWLTGPAGWRRTQDGHDVAQRGLRHAGNRATQAGARVAQSAQLSAAAAAAGGCRHGGPAVSCRDAPPAATAPWVQQGVPHTQARTRRRANAYVCATWRQLPRLAGLMGGSVLCWFCAPP